MSLLLEGVKKSYREPNGNRLPVLNVEWFQLDQAEQVVIAGITSPDEGCVTVDGNNLTALPEAARDRFRAERIGFVFQTFNLLPAFTALENVLLGMSFARGRSDRGRARELLTRVGLDHRFDHRPGQLSVGEQQRVAVARALANRPSLLLADEPTANVDPANQDAVLELILEVCAAEDVALLLVTHATEVARRFERVEQLSDFNRPEMLS